MSHQPKTSRFIAPDRLGAVALLLVIALGCTQKDAELDAGLTSTTPVYAITTCTAYTCQSCQQTGSIMSPTKTTCCIALLAAAGCVTPQPGPGPIPGIGGSVSTGGTSSVGGGRATGGKATTGGTSGQPGPVTIEVKACANLTMLACSEGLAPNCVAVLTNADTTRIENYDPKCLSTATSKAAVRKCGSGKTKCQ